MYFLLSCVWAQVHSIQETKTSKMATRKSRDLKGSGLPECWRGEPKESLMTQALAYGYFKMVPLKPLASSFHIWNKQRRLLSCRPSTNARLSPPAPQHVTRSKKLQQCWIKYTGLVYSQSQMPTISAESDHMAGRGVKETLPL